MWPPPPSTLSVSRAPALCRKVDALPASGVPRYLHIPPPRAQGMNHVSSPHHLLPHQAVCDSRPCRVADSSGIPQSVPRKEGESLGEAEARPSLWWVCVQKPGLTKPGHRAASCRADLSKTFFMPPKSQTTVQGLPFWPAQGLAHGEKAVPVLGAGVPSQSVAHRKIPLKRQLRIQSCQRRKEGGRASPRHTVCFLDSLAHTSRAAGSPDGPLLFLALPARSMQRGTGDRGQGQTRIHPAVPSSPPMK